MKKHTSLPSLVLAAVGMLTSSSHAASILYVGSSDNANYKAWALTQGHTWTFVVNGSGSGQIGGALSSSYTGGVQTKAQFMNTFSLVIVGTGISSGSLTDQVGWSALTAGVMINNLAAARNDRIGWSNSGAATTAVAAGYETDLLVTSGALYTTLTLGATVSSNQLNLYTDGQSADKLTVGNLPGTETVFGVTVGDTGRANLIYWAAGDTDGFAHSQAGRRFAYGFQNFDGLTADGKTVLNNAINLIAVPEPASALFVGLGAFVFITRRLRRA